MCVCVRACMRVCVRVCVLSQLHSACILSVTDLWGFSPGYSSFPIHPLRCLEQDAFSSSSNVGLLFFSLSLSPCIVQNSAPTTPTLSSNFDVIILITSHLFHLHITVMPTFFQTLFIKVLWFSFWSLSKGFSLWQTHGVFLQVPQFSHSSPEMSGTGCFFFLFQCWTLSFFFSSLSVLIHSYSKTQLSSLPPPLLCHLILTS